VANRALGRYRIGTSRSSEEKRSRQVLSHEPASDRNEPTQEVVMATPILAAPAAHSKPTHSARRARPTRRHLRAIQPGAQAGQIGDGVRTFTEFRPDVALALGLLALSGEELFARLGHDDGSTLAATARRVDELREYLEALLDVSTSARARLQAVAVVRVRQDEAAG
jgi:hypothetical protein